MSINTLPLPYPYLTFIYPWDNHTGMNYLHITIGLSIIGAVMVSLGQPLQANLIWIVTNPILAQYNYRIAQGEQALLFCVFSIIAGFGVVNLWN